MASKRWCPACQGPRQGPYCPECGGELRAPEDRTSWLLGGLAFAVVTLFMMAPVIRGERPDVPGPPGAPVAGPAGPQDRQMARRAADQLFDRVVEAAEADDSAQMALFLPMAIRAYQEARPLDADGLFHLSTLQRTSDLTADAGGTAREMLARDPNHLLGLYAAAEAAEKSGDHEAARAFYARLVEAWDGEIDRGRPEYQAHSDMLRDVRARAEALLGTG